MASYSQLRLQQLTGSIADLAYSGSQSSAQSSAGLALDDLGAVLGEFAGALGRISGKTGTGESAFTNQAAGVFSHASTKFGAGGNEFEIVESSDDVTLKALVQDKDLIFNVNDGGVDTEVFRLDGDASALKVATTKQVQFGKAALNIADDGTDIIVTSDADIALSAAGDVNLDANSGLTFGDDGEKIEGDGTDLTIASSAKINLTATSDVILPDSVGMLFGDVVAGGEKIEGDGTDLTIASSNLLNLSATTDVVVPVSVGVILGDGGEKIESDNTDLTVASGGAINLTATTDVAIPANVGLILDANGSEKIESDDTDLTVASGAKINLTATSDVVIPSNVGLVLDGSGAEKIESDGTDINIAVGALGDVNLPADIGLTFGNDGEKIEGNGTRLLIESSDALVLDAGSSMDLDASGGIFNFLDDTALGFKLDLATSAGDAIFKDGGNTEIFRLDDSADSLLMAGGLKIELRNANTFLHSPVANSIDISAASGNATVIAGGVQLSGSNGVGISGSFAISADGGMTSAPGPQAGKMLFANYPEFATFRAKDQFTSATTVIGALNILADAAGGGVVGTSRLAAQTLANADFSLSSLSSNAGFTAQIDSTSMEPANTEVYVNGQLLLSASSASGDPVAGGDYIVKSYADPGVLKFAFDLEVDDVVVVKTTAAQ